MIPRFSSSGTPPPPPLIDQRSSGARQLDEAERLALRDWIDAAPSADEMAGRNEAARRLFQCARWGLPFLDLSHCALSTLPAAIAHLTHLRSLDLQDNFFSDLPGVLLGMSELRMINLAGNAFTTVTAELLRLPIDCVVVLTGNRISYEERQQWRIQRDVLHHPTLIFNRPGPSTFAETLARPFRPTPPEPDAAPPVHSALATRINFGSGLEHYNFSPSATLLAAFRRFYAVPSPDITQAIGQWRRLAGGYGALLPELRPQTIAHLSDTPYAASFAQWLLRLSQTADHQGRLTRAPLHGRVLRVIEACIEYEAVRSTCFHIADESITSCADRLAIGLNQMEMAIINWRAEHGQFDASALLEMGRAQHRLALLEQISEEHATRMDRDHETIEVHLAFQVGLRERLALPLAIRSMLYRPSAEVSDKDLDLAFERITAAHETPAEPALAELQALNNSEQAIAFLLKAPAPHPLAQFLAEHYTPWRSHIERTHPETTASAREAMYALLDALDQALENGEINEGQYQRASQRAMFYANHGGAYRDTLTALIESGRR